MSTSRRAFLKYTAAGTLGSSSLSVGSVLGANETPVVALVGCGGRGGTFQQHAQFLCDPDEQRLGQFAERNKIPRANTCSDLRRILDNPDIDAVVITTPDHWHAPAAILACAAGKHVYVEKPCSHNFRESHLLLKMARRHNVVVQHGTQQRSDPAALQAMALLREGMIGDVLIARAWNIQLRSNIGRQQPSDPPPNVDYDLWVGPAEFMPFQRNRFHYDWHWWYNFGTGDIGNDGAHEIDFARWGLDVHTLPSRISATGGKYFHDDDQQFPDTATCVFEYPGDGQVGHIRQLIFEMRIWSTNYPHNCDSGVEFLGTKGKMVFSKRGRFEVFGERNKPVPIEKPATRATADHFGDFIDAIRNGRRPNADIEEAHRSVALIHLANLCVRLGRSIQFDPQSETITGDAEASQFLSRTYRAGGHWAVPQDIA